jgi:hypothetical protein
VTPWDRASGFESAVAFVGLELMRLCERMT